MRTRWMTWIVGVWLLGLPVGAAAEQMPPPPGQLNFLPSPISRTAAHASATPLVDQIAASHRTPSAIAAFLREGFTFRRDEDLFGEADRWQSPEEFLQRRVGDCEDYALLAQALLRRNGIESYVLSLLGEEGYAHTVAVFVDAEGCYNLLNQDKLRLYRAPSLEALASRLYPSWTVAMIAEQDGTRGRIVQELLNEHPGPSLDEPPNLDF